MKMNIWYQTKKIMESHIDKKFYVPDISEFHVGFEYEVEDLGDDGATRVWRSQVFEGEETRTYFVEELQKNEMRVKYLDEEDITSLGFEWNSSCDNYSLYSSKDFIDAGVKKYLRITHYEQKNICHIETLESDRLGRYSTKFDGVIKNKSELKRVLNQIGYSHLIN